MIYSGEKLNEAFYSKGFHPYRTDDRCGDHRYSGCYRIACLSGDYTIRTRVSEGLTLASAAKTAVSETFANTSTGEVAAYDDGTGPQTPVTDMATYGYTYTSGTNVKFIVIKGVEDVTDPQAGEGVIQITYDTAAGQAGAVNE